MRKASGEASWTMYFNGIYLVLLVVNELLGTIGFVSFEPSPEVVTIGTALVVIVNLVLRYFRTKEPIAK